MIICDIQAALERFYKQNVLPVMASSPHLRHTKPFPLPPSFDTFLHAYSLISSRAFHIDDYHHVGLVTPADLFVPLLPSPFCYPSQTTNADSPSTQQV